VARRGERDGGGHSTGDLAGGEISPAGSSSPSVGMTCGVEGPTVNPWGTRLGVDPGGSSIFGRLLFQKLGK
jgi:hypothetical protein